MEQVLFYVVIAGLAVTVTMLLLFITKTPVIVIIGAALLVGSTVVISSRVELGFWDPLAPIAFVANSLYAFAISGVVLAIGRRLRWPFFLSKRRST